MKALFTVLAVLAAIAIAAPMSLAAGKPQGQTFITDTLSGNNPARTAHEHGYNLITDTLAVSNPARTAHEHGYSFVTDTLAGNGGPQVTTVFRNAGFSWKDAGIGAAAVAGSILLLLGSARVVVRRRTGLAA
jgi:hypothetical protein